MLDVVEYYNQNAKTLNERYEGVSLQGVHGDALGYLPKSGRVLEVGSGSGRDAVGLVDLGFDVLAVEPSYMFRELIEVNHPGKLTVVDASLPELSHPKIDVGVWDVIFVSAVWMHLNEEDQKAGLNRLKSLLSDNGVLVIVWRGVDGEVDRGFHEVNVELLGASHILGSEDALNRKHLTGWQTAIIYK